VIIRAGNRAQHNSVTTTRAGLPDPQEVHVVEAAPVVAEEEEEGARGYRIHNSCSLISVHCSLLWHNNCTPHAVYNKQCAYYTTYSQV